MQVLFMINLLETSVELATYRDLPLTLACSSKRTLTTCNVRLHDLNRMGSFQRLRVRK